MYLEAIANVIDDNILMFLRQTNVTCKDSHKEGGWRWTLKLLRQLHKSRKEHEMRQLFFCVLASLSIVMDHGFIAAYDGLDHPAIIFQQDYF